MKTCGIKLDKDTIRFIILEQKGDEIEIQENFYTLKDTISSKGFNSFKDVVYSFIDNHSPDKIAIISRLASGKLQSHGISFKNEGMLQLYPSRAVELIASKTINAFIKKNPHSLNPTYINFKEALDLAYFLLFN